MTPRSFTVETRGEAVAIFGGPSSLASSLVHEFLSRNIHAESITTTQEFQALTALHDPDYLLVFEDFNLDQFSSLLKPLIDSGESRLILVNHTSSPAKPSPLAPIYKRLIFSDYVGSTQIYSPLIESWLAALCTSHTIAVPGDGLGELGLLGENDLVKLIALSLLSPTSTPGQKIALGNPTAMSPLNLAYLIRTNAPYKIGVTFNPSDLDSTPIFTQDIYQNTLDQLNYQCQDSVEDLLIKYLHAHLKNPAPSAALPPAPLAMSTPKKLTPLKINAPVFIPLQSRRFRPPRTSRPHSILGRGVVIALALYFGTLAFSFTFSSLSLKSISHSLQTNELPPSNSFNNFSLSYLRANWIALTSIFGLSKQNLVVDGSLLLDSYSQTLSLFKTAHALSQSTADLTSYIFGSGNKDVAQLVSLSRLQAEELYQQLSLLDGSLPSVAPHIIPRRYQNSYLSAKTKLTSLKRSLSTTRALLAAAPDLIGLGGRRKYAVLFENNMELRATGGFIGSFAILSFENGKLYDMPIYDVYDADGQLKGHVEPPRPIKDILGEANWYLRDSNFDPDFPTSARRAEWFIKKTLNQDLDGTIAINLSSLSSLLKATGPLEIPDYNETISDTNLYERAQFHAEVNFFPGSTQKKEFLSTVGNALFAKLPGLGAGEGLKLITALTDSIEQKNTLISPLNPSTSHVFSTLGWNGELNSSPCPLAVNCVQDYAMVVDSNFGVNKANYFIKRHLEEIVTFDKNLAVGHVLRLFYQNTSTSTAWPAGAYKNYQRLYLPPGSIVSGVKIGDKQLEPKDYTLTSEHGKLVLAYLMIVPINDQLVVEIEYATPSLSQDKEASYTWYWQKQPGTSSQDSLSVYLNYPLYLKPTVISPTAELAPQQLKFVMLNDTDHRLTVKFTK